MKVFLLSIIYISISYFITVFLKNKLSVLTRLTASFVNQLFIKLNIYLKPNYSTRFKTIKI
jgi:hypothetical protein